MNTRPLSPPHGMPMQRIAYLDGMRFFAIFSVMLFHYFSGWVYPDFFYPYGPDYAEFPLFKYGYLGVEFFFMISGFVIMMTLERCSSWVEFAVRRAARLMPAMIIFSLVTYGIVESFAPNLFEVRPQAFIASWTFIGPEILNHISQTNNLTSVDSVYWSLYVEVRFYITIAALYFITKYFSPDPNVFYKAFLLYFLVAFVAADITLFFNMDGLNRVIGYIVFPTRFPWFAFGIGFYLYFQKNAYHYSYAFFLLGLVQLLFTGTYEPQTDEFVIKTIALIVPFVLPAIFFAVMKLEVLQRILSFKPFVLIGAASYGLYLVHQNAGLLLIQHGGEFFNLTGVPSLSIPVAVIVGMIVFTGLVFKYIEHPLNRAIVRWWKKTYRDND